MCALGPRKANRQARTHDNWKPVGGRRCADDRLSYQMRKHVDCVLIRAAVAHRTDG